MKFSLQYLSAGPNPFQTLYLSQLKVLV